MFKKFFSFITIASILISSNFGFYSVYAVDTNNLSSPWSIEKARHLAKKALFWATKTQIDQLLAVWSAENAVNVLFPSKNGPSRTAFDTMLSDTINDPWFNPGAISDMYNYYMTKKAFDPYEAKAKFFMIFEDTFSVNNSSSKDVSYLDIENTHDLLYSHTLWNYKEMIKRSLFNNWNPGDYSVSKFLDLLNQTDPKKPNENYARELLQLLLMLEYIPTETPDNWDVRNYTETDVDVLSKILIWFQSNENTHEISFDPSKNTNESFVFLEWDLKTWDMFPFYNSASWTVDIQMMKTSIWWNNGLADNTIDYIFSKKENAIALFLADKFYRFYVAENPSRGDLNIIANEIVRNNFDLYTTVKWLLAHDMMYTDKSMNDIIYKNPIELTVWTFKILWIDDMYKLKYTSNTLGWRPYYPGSIFWRDWFDDNKEFFNTTTSIRWASEASRIVNELNIDTFIDKTDNLNELIADLESKFYGGQLLTADIKQKLVNFMSLDKDGNVVVFDLNSDDYNKYYTKGLIHMMLIQPEYVLQSWYDLASEPKWQNNSFYNNDNKIVFVYFGGWMDWLHAVIPKNEYPQYLEKRLTWALTGTGIIELDNENFINSSLEEFKNLHDSGDLKVINRVWTPSHSRSHDAARRKMTSLNNEYSSKWMWIIWNFIQDEDPLKTLVINKGWVEFRGWKSLNVWSDALFRISDSTNNDFRVHKIAALKDIYLTRTYPKNLDLIFENSVHIWNVAEASISNGWRSWAWYSMKDNFTFIENLFDAGLTNVVSMQADGWYDTHGRQKDSLNKNLKNVAEKTTAFYNAVKDKHNVTIVLYSEFWRTTKINSSEWTDHWKWGWMFILSNNEEFKTSMPEKTYWNNSFANAQANRLWIGIDYRAIYSRLLKDIYNQDISSALWGDYNINNYIDTTDPETDLFRIDFSRDGNNSYAKIKFTVDDDNYFHDEASHIQLWYGTDVNDLKYTRYTDINRYMLKDDNKVELRIWRVSPNREYFYKINIFDNQYNLKTLEGSFTSPVVNDSNNQVLNITGKTRFRKLENKMITWKLMLPESEQIILTSDSNVTFTWENNITMEATNTGTIVESVETSTGTLWDGTFLLPSEIPVWDFLDWEWNFWANKLKNLRVEKVIKVWADTLGVGLTLNKPVKINVPGVTSWKNYTVLFSEDGQDWKQLENANIVKNSTNLQFTTSHFTYFALAESTTNGWIPVVDNTWNNDWWDNWTWNWNDSWDNGWDNSGENNGNWNNNSSSGWGWGWIKLVKDYCRYWDYSASYYDKNCWKSVNAKELYNLVAKNKNLKNISVNDENDEINFALLELQDYEWDKFNIYTQLFSDVNSSTIDQEKVLFLLRENTSTTNIWDYKLHYIKSSEKNAVFKKIAQLFLKWKYSTEYKEKIVASINDLILAYAVLQIDWLTSNTKIKAKKELENSITSLKYNYKLAQASLKQYSSLTPVKRVYTQETTQKTSDYYKSRKEAILRKHKDKQK